MAKAGKTYYMHLLDSWPASFFKGEGVLFSGKITLATSLRQIRSEQQESKRIRTKKVGYDDGKYDYRIVVTPSSTTPREGQ